MARKPAWVLSATAHSTACTSTKMMLALPSPVLRELKKLSVEVVRQESEKSPMARKVHASFTKFQAVVRLNSAVELDYYRHGGILQRVLRQFLREGLA